MVAKARGGRVPGMARRAGGMALRVRDREARAVGCGLWAVEARAVGREPHRNAGPDECENVPALLYISK